MEQDFMNRGYLLPPGCKDLIDAMKLNVQAPPFPASLIDASAITPKLTPPHLEELIKKLNQLTAGSNWMSGMMALGKKASAPPPVKGQLAIPAETTVAQLAALLDKTPMQIAYVLLEMRMSESDAASLSGMVSYDEVLSFDIIFQVARKYGFVAIRAAL
jgi:hypothetical protein